MTHLFAFTAGCYFGLFLFAIMSMLKRNSIYEHTDESLCDIACKPAVDYETVNRCGPCRDRENNAGVSQDSSGSGNRVFFYRNRASTIGSDGKWELFRLEREDG